MKSVSIQQQRVKVIETEKAIVYTTLALKQR